MFENRTTDSFSRLFFETTTFPIGVELVSTRGWSDGTSRKRVLSFAEELKEHQRVDWVSITDNAGGHPRMSPLALGMPILYGGKDVIIHLTGKDLNRHALESQLWLLASHGFHNVLALTGDHPGNVPHGRAKPVFDLDSVGIISLMRALNSGDGLGETKTKSEPQLTHFNPGCTVNPFKPNPIDRELQYLKLESKLHNGAKYIIPQIGFSIKDLRELRAWTRKNTEYRSPLIANIFIPTSKVLKLFNSGKIPGVHLNRKTYEKMIKKASDTESPQEAYLRYSALMMTAAKRLGYDGCYLGGLQNAEQLNVLLQLYDQIVGQDPFEELEHWLVEETTVYEDPVDIFEKIRLNLNQNVHDLAFEENSVISRFATLSSKCIKENSYAYKTLHSAERVLKSLAFDCHDCGDCLLPKTAYHCPESKCGKHLRNGPCGGSFNGTCEVKEQACLWNTAYMGMKHLGREEELISRSPKLLDHDLRGTSGWINHWKNLKHLSHKEKECPTQTLQSSAN